MSARPAVYLVDGTYLLFRAFHSLPSTMALTGEAYRRQREALIGLLQEGAGTSTEPDGIAGATVEWLRDPSHDRLPTNAIRGLTSVLMKILREERPAYIGVAFDLPGRVHRDDAYDRFVVEHPNYAPSLAGYKATRPETPVELDAQFPLARIVCRRALGIPILEAASFEADDLIGTLACRARDRGHPVRIVTADKDLFQLVDGTVSVLNPHKPDPKGPSGYLLMDPKIVEREFGVPPAKVVDVLALVGDASDNIPGVPGIGDKGARELIARFGSVEGCLIAASEEGAIARNAYRKGLLEHEPLARLSKELATIDTHAPIDLDVEDLRSADPAPDETTRIFSLLAFGTFLTEGNRLSGRDTSGAREAPRDGPGEGAVEERSLTQAVGEGAKRETPPPGGRGTGRSRPMEEQARLPGSGEGEGAERGAARSQSSLPGTPVGGRAKGGGPPAPESPTGGSPGSGGVAAPGSIDFQTADSDRYRAVLTLAELRTLLPSILAAPHVAIDTETTSEDPMRARLVGISLAWEEGRAIYVPVAHRYLGAPAQPAAGEVLALLAPLFEGARPVRVGQNVKYDIEILKRAGARIVDFGFDTMIAAFLLQPDRLTFGLASLAKEYLDDTKTPFDEVAGKGAKQVTFDEVPIARAAAYAGRDADVTLRLAAVLRERLAAEGLDRVLASIDMPLVEVLVAMEMAGIRIDVPLLARLARETGEQITALRSEIHRLAGREFNVDSPRQLAQILFAEIGLRPVSKTEKAGLPSTRDEDLEVLAEQHPLPAKVREYRSLEKLRSTYIEALPRMVNPETGRVHTSFHPTGAATGRLSSSDPNLQNIPVRTAEGRKIRAAFVPEPGWTLVSADYSQIELRVLAHLSEDQGLTEAFARGEDIHRSTAARIFSIPYDAVDADQRRAAKTINFGILYGMGPVRLAKELGIPQAEAKALIEQYFGRFPGIRAYMDGTIARAEKDGYVSTLFGRIRRFPQLVSSSRNQRQMAVRAAVNSTIQGTAADIMKLAMVRLHRAIAESSLSARILVQVHDELVLETPPAELPALRETIRAAMEEVLAFRVPLTVDIGSGPSWLEAKS